MLEGSLVSPAMMLPASKVELMCILPLSLVRRSLAAMALAAAALLLRR
jgi:hypothetical protein